MKAVSDEVMEVMGDLTLKIQLTYSLSPGHSEFFNVARWKTGGPGMRRHSRDAGDRSEVEAV